MLDKMVFFKGIDMLINEYSDRGFIMTEEKAKQWYNYMKDISPNEYMKKIENCLKTCRRVPFMADVLDLKEEDVKSKANAGAYKEITE